MYAIRSYYVAEHQRQLLGLLPQIDVFLDRLNKTENVQLMKQLRAGLQRICNELAQDTIQLGYQAEDIYQRTMELRLLPLASITDDFERSLRDLARALGKEIDFRNNFV